MAIMTIVKKTVNMRNSSDNKRIDNIEMINRLTCSDLLYFYLYFG